MGVFLSQNSTNCVADAASTVLKLCAIAYLLRMVGSCARAPPPNGDDDSTSLTSFFFIGERYRVLKQHFSLVIQEKFFKFKTNLANRFFVFV